MQWETLLSLSASLAAFAYAAGISRQRIAELERRMEASERLTADRDRILTVALQDIRDRVIAIDEWRKHVPEGRVKRGGGEAG
jgi:hypothetical protein